MVDPIVMHQTVEVVGDGTNPPRTTTNLYVADETKGLTHVGFMIVDQSIQGSRRARERGVPGLREPHGRAPPPARREGRALSAQPKRRPAMTKIRRKAPSRRTAARQQVKVIAQAYLAHEDDFMVERVGPRYHEAPVPRSPTVVRYLTVVEAIPVNTTVKDQDGKPYVRAGHRVTPGPRIVETVPPYGNPVGFRRLNPDILGRPLVWTPEDVRHWLTEALTTIQVLYAGRHLWPEGSRAAWPDVVHTVEEAYGWELPELIRLPTMEEIGRMDFVLPAWLALLDDPRARNAVIGVGLQLNLRTIGKKLGCSHETARTVQAEAFELLARRLNEGALR